jgi:delta1-piperideine-2-carboxylate reductase
MADVVHTTLEEVGATARAVLKAKGFSDAHADAIARTLTKAERDECKHHGLFRVPFYVKASEAGHASPTAEPEITDLAPGVVRIDAKRGFSPLALEMGHGPLVERARTQGIALLAINNVVNVAALWPEVERLAEDGLVGLAMTSAIPYVAPHGGKKSVFGTNPMAFAWPRAGKPPMVFDQASSMSARGTIQIKMRDGESLPEGWAIDAEGKPTTDPAAALAGAQLPFGGAKGSAIAMMIELLAGPLIGDTLSIDAGADDVHGTGAPCGGEVVIAIDPARCAAGGDPASRIAHGERLFEAILAQEGTRLPGDRRYAARARTPTDGVTVAASLWETLKRMAG